MRNSTKNKIRKEISKLMAKNIKVMSGTHAYESMNQCIEGIETVVEEHNIILCEVERCLFNRKMSNGTRCEKTTVFLNSQGTCKHIKIPESCKEEPLEEDD